MTRLTCSLLALLLAGCMGLPVYEAQLGRYVTVKVVSQYAVQAECSKRGVGLHPLVAYISLTANFGCTVGYTNGSIEVFTVDSAGSLLHELDHAFNKKRCHDLLGRPATC